MEKSAPKMKPGSMPKAVAILLWLLLIASILFWILSAYQLVQINKTRHEQLLESTSLNVDEANFHLPGRTALLQKITVSDVQPWMTFNYLNYEFSLATSTLKQTLGITDQHYPYLSIYHVAREQHVSATSTTVIVQRAITGALESQSQTQTQSQ